MTRPVDPYTPSYQAACHWARKAAEDAMGESDKRAGRAVFARLLWLLDSADGGFIGLADEQLEECAYRNNLRDMAVVNAAQWAPGEWPKRAAEQRVAA